MASDPQGGKRWMVVRRSRTIPGGYRVVQYGLNEDLARRWAAEYASPHEAMSEWHLRRLRLAGLMPPPAALGGRDETIDESRDG